VYKHSVTKLIEWIIFSALYDAGWLASVEQIVRV